MAIAPPAPPEVRIGWHRLGAIGTLVAGLTITLAAGVGGSPGPVPRPGHDHGPDLTLGWIWLTATVALTLACFAAVHRRKQRLCFLVWPAVNLVSINLLGLIDQPAASLVVGLIYVSFLFAGLTQPRGRSLVLLPLGLVGLYLALDLPLHQTAVRLCVAAFGWTTTAELPALLLRRLVAQQKVLEVTAETDVLTGLRNRNGLPALLDERAGNAYLVLVDLDHFKQYNDTFGHLAGDHLLVDFAGLLKAETRHNDVVVRYGGEEFLIVLDGVDRQAAESIVGRLRGAWQNTQHGISFSAGVTDLDGPSALGRADALLYVAKSTGRNRAVVGTADDDRTPLASAVCPPPVEEEPVPAQRIAN